jgi:tRNA pseudouridine55 synthase
VNAAPHQAIGSAPPEPVPFSGLLVVDKPAGVTSHDVVSVVRRRLRADGAGHLGTLDPGASGLLLMALGAATRAIQVWQGGDKTYEATLLFGVTTSSQDVHGEVLERRPVEFDRARMEDEARAFVGEIEQIPPMVSALKVGGERLYRLARRGIEVERAPRRVRVDSWEWLDVVLPEARVRIRCSGGTYVRTLAHDLGQRLGCGAALKTLRRLRSEPFGLERSVTLRELNERAPADVLARAGVPLDEALGVLPAVAVGEAEAAAIGYGGRPSVERGAAPIGAGPRSVVVRDGAGRALALGELVATPESDERALFCPHVVFPWAVRQGRPA